MARIKHAPKKHAPPKKQAFMSARKSAPETVGIKLKRRAKSGVKALREIKYIQESAELQIPKRPFYNLARELGWDRKTDLMWNKGGIEALQEASEDFVTHLFEESVRAAKHAGRATVSLKDVQFARETLMRTTRFHPSDVPIELP